MKNRSIALLALSAASVTASATVMFQTSFEPSTYTLGNLHGQDGWSTSTTNPQSYIVSNAQAKSGTQSAMSDQAQSTGGSRWAWQTFASAFTATSHPGEPTLYASVWVYMEATTSTPSWYGMDFWSNGVANRASGLQISNGMIDFFDRALNAGAGGWVTVNDASIGFNQWHHLELFASFQGNQTWARINGNMHSVTGTLTFNNIDEVDLFTFKETGSTQRGFYDDYSLSAVPEPMTLLALSAGVAALLARRRNR